MINWDNVEFKDEKRFLSNMYPCFIKMDSSFAGKYPMFMFDDQIYGSSEHLYQALKSNSMEYRRIIRELEKSTKTKTKSRQILKTDSDRGLFDEGFYFLRSDWDDVKVDAMRLCLELKFGQNEELRQLLLNTGLSHIEERNDWKDIFWGTYLGEGQNILGLMLMDLRAVFRCSQDPQ